MPVIRDIPLSLRISEVLRRQGLGGGAKVRPEIRLLIRELLASLRKSHLLEPAVAHEHYTVKNMNDSQISLDGDRGIHGPLLPTIFPEAKELAVMLCTIGSKLEEQVTEYSSNGETLRGMILDGIGSSAVDKLVSVALALVAAETSLRGCEISSPVSPGMAGFPLTEQRNLLRLTRADEIGVGLTASQALVPGKSTFMIIGTGPQMIRWTQAEVCTRCSLRESLHYKATK